MSRRIWWSNTGCHFSILFLLLTFSGVSYRRVLFGQLLGGKTRKEEEEIWMLACCWESITEILLWIYWITSLIDVVAYSHLCCCDLHDDKIWWRFLTSDAFLSVHICKGFCWCQEHISHYLYCSSLAHCSMCVYFSLFIIRK